jgi:hypothetical protein
MDNTYFGADRMPVDVAIYDSVDFRFIQKAVRPICIYLALYQIWCSHDSDFKGYRKKALPPLQDREV